MTFKRPWRFSRAKILGLISNSPTTADPGC
jgi:hypothetical protein